MNFLGGRDQILPLAPLRALRAPLHHLEAQQPLELALLLGRLRARAEAHDALCHPAVEVALQLAQPGHGDQVGPENEK